MGTGIGKNVVEIAALLISVALISMLVQNASGTTQIIESGGNTFANLINTATGKGFN